MLFDERKPRGKFLRDATMKGSSKARDRTVPAGAAAVTGPGACALLRVTPDFFFVVPGAATAVLAFSQAAWAAATRSLRLCARSAA